MITDPTELIIIPLLVLVTGAYTMVELEFPLDKLIAYGKARVHEVALVVVLATQVAAGLVTATPPTEMVVGTQLKPVPHGVVVASQRVEVKTELMQEYCTAVVLLITSLAVTLAVN